MSFLITAYTVLGLLALILPTTVSGHKVVLLDTTTHNSLDWTRYPYGPNSPTPGWVEESFTNFDKGINWRSYVVCDVAYNNVNNWLWTPFIERKDANRIFIEIKFSMRDCSLFPGTALSCKETFSLLYYEFDSAKEPGTHPWEPESYKLIDRIAADEGRFTSNSEVIINTEVRSIPVTKNGVYFAFRDQGACLSLISIKIYSVVCPSVVSNFGLFPETPTGSELTAIVPAEGQCVANSVVVDSSPRLLCKGDGNWTLPTGGCKCLPGYEPSDSNNSCKSCPVGKFKSSVGDEACIPCPAHSKTGNHRGSTECSCEEGHVRVDSEAKWAPCIRADLVESHQLQQQHPPHRMSNNDTSSSSRSEVKRGTTRIPSYVNSVFPSLRNSTSTSSQNSFLHKNGVVGKRDSVREYGLIAGVSAAVVAIVGVVILMVIVYLRRTADDCSKKQPSDCDTLEYTRAGEVVSSMDHPPLVPTARFNSHTYMSPYGMSSKSTPIFTNYNLHTTTLSTTSPSYAVETHTYEEPNQILPLTMIKNGQPIGGSSSMMTTLPPLHHSHHFNTTHHHQQNSISYGATGYNDDNNSRQQCDFSIHDHISRTLGLAASSRASSNHFTTGRRTNL